MPPGTRADEYLPCMAGDSVSGASRRRSPLQALVAVRLGAPFRALTTGPRWRRCFHRHVVHAAPPPHCRVRPESGPGAPRERQRAHSDGCHQCQQWVHVNRCTAHVVRRPHHHARLGPPPQHWRGRPCCTVTHELGKWGLGVTRTWPCTPRVARGVCWRCVAVPVQRVACPGGPQRGGWRRREPGHDVCGAASPQVRRHCAACGPPFPFLDQAMRPLACWAGCFSHTRARAGTALWATWLHRVTRCSCSTGGGTPSSGSATTPFHAAPHP